MKQRTIQGMGAAILGLLALGGVATESQAQMEAGVMRIIQNGREVGQIYVPARSAGSETYMEYWFLYPGYVYPSAAQTKLETRIVAAGENFISLEEYRRNAKFEPGTRLVEVASREAVLK